MIEPVQMLLTGMAIVLLGIAADIAWCFFSFRFGKDIYRFPMVFYITGFLLSFSSIVVLIYRAVNLFLVG